MVLLMFFVYTNDNLHWFPSYIYIYIYFLVSYFSFNLQKDWQRTTIMYWERTSGSSSGPSMKLCTSSSTHRDQLRSPAWHRGRGGARISMSREGSAAHWPSSHPNNICTSSRGGSEPGMFLRSFTKSHPNITPAGRDVTGCFEIGHFRRTSQAWTVSRV